MRCDKWIALNDRPPSEKVSVLVGSSIVHFVLIGVYLDGVFVNNLIDKVEIGFVTHWMELPNPPK